MVKCLEGRGKKEEGRAKREEGLIYLGEKEEGISKKREVHKLSNGCYIRTSARGLETRFLPRYFSTKPRFIPETGFLRRKSCIQTSLASVNALSLSK